MPDHVNTLKWALGEPWLESSNRSFPTDSTLDAGLKVPVHDGEQECIDLLADLHHVLGLHLTQIGRQRSEGENVPNR